MSTTILRRVMETDPWRDQVMGEFCMLEVLDGEKLCKVGRYKSAVLCFERALKAEPQDVELLVAIYSHLGNCHFCMKDYSSSVDYHKNALDLCRANHLQNQEASAWGSMGSSLRASGSYERAIFCCEHQLKLAKEMGNKALEAKACYNLGDIHCARAKAIGQPDNCDPGNYPTTAREALRKAAQLYEESIQLSREAGNRLAEGRVYGSLGNVHYLLGSFALAIDCHEKRLAIAMEFGDRSAKRRAYMNIGNARIFLGEFHEAVEMFLMSLSLSVELGLRAEEGQACFSLGNAYMFLKDNENAVEYYSRHLLIAKELLDVAGEDQIGDEVGQRMAGLSLSELRAMIDGGNHPVQQLIDIASHPLECTYNDKPVLEAASDLSSSSPSVGSDSVDCTSTRGLLMEKEDVVTDLRARRKSMEKLDILAVTPNKMRLLKHTKKTKAVDRNTPGKGPSRSLVKSSHMQKASPSEMDAAENFLELLSRSQSRRINEQRCSVALLRNPDRFKGSPIPSINTSSSSSEPESFFDLLARSQSRRIDDQRCPSRLLELDRSIVHSRESAAKEDKENRRPQIEVDAEERFLNLVANVQGSQLHNQRSSIRGSNADQRSGTISSSLDLENRDRRKTLLQQQNGRIEHSQPTKPLHPTIPEDDDFITLIQRAQSTRLDEQRYSAAPQNSLPVRPIPRQPEPKPGRANSDSEQRKACDAAPLLSKPKRNRFGSRK